MTRSVDHLVLAAKDLDGLGGAYRRLGFLVGGRNRHPWGTENRIVQLEGSFLELISTADDFQRLDPAEAAAPFANTIEAVIAQREGLAMVAFTTGDAAEDARRLAEAKLGGGASLSFSRSAEAKDGTRREVAFTTVFAAVPPAPPEFFVCQHHHPENFWNPAMQAHPNGARRLLGLAMVADQPSEKAPVLSALFGADRVESRDDGLTIETGRERLDVIDRARFERIYGSAVAPRPFAMRIGVDSLDAVTRFLNVMGSPYRRESRRLIVPAKVARGATLSFESLG